MEPSFQPPCRRTEADKHTITSCVPYPNCRGGVIGLAIAGDLENDGRLSPWQEAVGHEIIPDTHKDGCDWCHAQAVRDAVSGGRVRLTGMRESILQPISAKR
jgi:hypothetical protein